MHKQPAHARMEIVRRPLLFVAGLLTLAALGVSTAAASPTPYTFNWTGTPSSPQATVPATWDVQIHKRDPGDSMETMNAAHGADCAASPASHTISTLAQGVFICNNHLMTAIGDSGYGEIALTPDHMADWSSGTTAITFNVSTQQDNNSDWIEVWVSPFVDNQTLPFEPNAIDMQGPPKNALVFSLNMSGLLGSHSGDVTPISNYTEGNPLPKLACTYSGAPTCIQPASIGPSVLSLSSVTRAKYEIDISSGHIKFGLPGLVTWTDTNFNVPFTQGVVQLVHHSYNPLKHDPGTGIDTWHWSNFAISNAVPFTILNGAERSMSAGTSSTIHFPAPAPAGSYLRFSALGNLAVSWDGGATYHAAVLESPVLHIEHFSSYMTPIPAGTQSVLVRGTNNLYGQSWWIRDPAIWSLTTSTPPASSPTPSAGPSPLPSPSPSPSSSPSPSPSPLPSPSPPPISITNMPCTVTMNGVQKTGTCSGTFQST